MKVYSISKPAFWAILALILALPVSRHWRLISSGERTIGLVCRNDYLRKEGFDGSTRYILRSAIIYTAGDSSYTTYGPPYYAFEPGTRLKVIYQKNKPSKCCLWNFRGLYLKSYSIIVLTMICFWIAFYLSYNAYVNQKRARKTPANRQATAGPLLTGQTGARRSTTEGPGTRQSTADTDRPNTGNRASETANKEANALKRAVQRRIKF